MAFAQNSVDDPDFDSRYPRPQPPFAPRASSADSFGASSSVSPRAGEIAVVEAVDEIPTHRSTCQTDLARARGTERAAREFVEQRKAVAPS